MKRKKMIDKKKKTEQQFEGQKKNGLPNINKPKVVRLVTVLQQTTYLQSLTKKSLGQYKNTSGDSVQFANCNMDNKICYSI